MPYAKDRIASAILLCFAIGVFIASGNFRFESSIFPRMVSLIMAISSIMMFLRTVSFNKDLEPQAAKDPNVDSPFFRNPVNFFIASFGFIIYLVAIGILGYFVSTAIMIVSIVLLLGFRDYRMIAISGAAFMLLVYVVFRLIFERPLPRGLFF
ncbi:tripartite tricarboxylate transporter TctB family protein [Fodinicurvata sp. EGI_FJ10296]|uniref:tripartite tricarboxylate transporter TctB family protein n=1 Tax=Fodinicurvata sp. EGI_FJ10296 TaxID=3231908 RepID=UPI003453BA52